MMKKIHKLIIIYLFSLLLPLTGYDLALLIEQKNKPKDMKSTITMEIKNHKGKIRTSSIKSISKDNNEKQILWFLKPADDRGVAYLKIEHTDKDDEMRLWLPAFKRIRRISSKKKTESFMGSDMSYEDMTNRDINEYNYKMIGEEIIENKNCYILESIPLGKSDYSKHISWVSKESLNPIKENSYDRNNKHIKSKSFEYKRLGDYFLVTKLHVKNMQKQHETTLKFSDIVVDSNVPDNVFQEKNLKRLRY